MHWPTAFYCSIVLFDTSKNFPTKSSDVARSKIEFGLRTNQVGGLSNAGGGGGAIEPPG